jgi:hypothetical protein
MKLAMNGTESQSWWQTGEVSFGKVGSALGGVSNQPPAVVWITTASAFTSNKPLFAIATASVRSPDIIFQVDGSTIWANRPIIASSGAFIAQPFSVNVGSGMTVGNVQFTTFMSTLDARINGISGGGVPPSVQSPSTGIYNLQSDAGTRYGIANSSGIEVGQNGLNLTTYMSTTDARINGLSPGGGASPTLQSPATGPYNLNNVGSVINSTGVYLSSGSVGIGTNTCPGLLCIDSNTSVNNLVRITTNGTNIFDLWPSTWQVNVATTIYVTGFLGVGTTVQQAPANISGIINPWLRLSNRLDSPQSNNLTGAANVDILLGSKLSGSRMVFQNNSGILEFGYPTSGGGFIGTADNGNLQLRTNDSTFLTGDTSQNAAFTGKLKVGNSGTGGSGFQVDNGSATIRSLGTTSNTGGEGLAVGTTMFYVHTGGGISIGTNVPTIPLNIDMLVRNGGPQVWVSSGPTRFEEITSSSHSWFTGVSTLSFSSGAFLLSGASITIKGEGNSNWITISSMNVFLSSGSTFAMNTSSPLARFQIGLIPVIGGAESSMILIGTQTLKGGNSLGTLIGMDVGGQQFNGDIMNLQTAGVSRFKLDVSGAITMVGGFTSAINSAGATIAGASGSPLTYGNNGQSGSTNLYLLAGLGAHRPTDSIIASQITQKNYMAVTTTGVWIGNNGTQVPYSIASGLSVTATTSTARGSVVMIQSSAPKNANNDSSLVFVDSTTNFQSVIDSSGNFVVSRSTSYLGAALSVFSPTEKVNNLSISSYVAVFTSAPASNPSQYFMAITTYGAISFSSTTLPTLSGAGAGASVRGGRYNFSVNPGTGANGFTATFSVPFKNMPLCEAIPQVGSVVNTFGFTYNNTSITITQTGLGTGNVTVNCFGLSE